MMKYLSLVTLAVVFGVLGCQPNVESFTLQVPKELALSKLSEDTLDTLRAEASIEGVLSASPLTINREKNLAMGTFTIPNQKVKDALIEVSYFASLNAESEEVLVAKNEAVLTLKKGQLNKPTFGPVTSSGSLAFDLNRNDKSNLEDLIAGIDPASQANPIVVTPETLSFESGIEVGSYSRTFFVVSNQSTESTSLEFDVRLAPGVTVAPLENLLDIAAPVAGESFALDLGPGDEKVMALTFAPTNALFVVGGLIVAAQMGDSDVKHQSFLRIIGNPNGAVPQPPSGYTIPMPTEEQQISAYTGSVEAFPDSNLFSRSALASSVVEAEEGTVGGYDVDQGYLVLVPKGYRFSLALEELDQDVDLYLFELDESFQPIGEEPLMASQNSGISVESVEFDGTQMNAESALLFIGVDVIGIELSAEVLTALSDEDLSPNATAYSAALYKTPEFWGVHSSMACPAAYDESAACGPETGGTSFYVYGKNFGDWVSVDIGRAAATCSGVLPGESLNEEQTTLDLENYDRVYCLSPAAFDDARLQGTAAVVVRDSNGAAATAPDSWTYLPPSPSITSLSETSGPKVGGLPLTIQGEAFYVRAGELPGVSFGENAAQVQSINEDGSQLLVYVPACDTCARDTAVDVVVTNPDGQSDTLAGAFTYEEPAGPAPTLSAVTPESGSREGGATLTLSGTDFTSPMSVALGENIISSIVPESTTSLTLTLPARASAGVVDVQVFNADNQTAILREGFTYTNPAPTVAQVSPDTGIVAGGQVVTIMGENFLEGASVSFGNTPAAALAYVSESVLTATTPSQAEGTVTIKVTNLDGLSGSLNEAFTYTNPTAPSPTLSAIDQSSGSTSGGLAVTLTGTNFQAGVQIYFGGTSASSVTYNSASELVAATPARRAGVVDVMVLNPDGQSATLAQAFTYAVPAPSVTALLPSSGPEAGGTVVVLSGTGFQDGATVSFGSYSATSVQFNSTSSMTVTAPTGSAGDVSVTLTNPDGQKSTSTYSYVEPTAAAPALYYVEPSTGTYRGGTTVSLEGSDFDTQGAKVFFDGVEATVLSRSESVLEVLSLPGDVGVTAVVQVQNSDGQSAGSAFTYTDDEPELSLNRLLPNSGAAIEVQDGVLVVGEAFESGATLSISDSSGNCFATNTTASDVVWLSASVLIVQLPACTETPTQDTNVDLVLLNPDGEEASLGDAFTYEAQEQETPAPAIVSIEPGYGPPSVTTQVTVSGENFTTDAKVVLEVDGSAVDATLVGTPSTTEITFVMPALAVPTVMGEVWGNKFRNFAVVNDGGDGPEVQGSFLYLRAECTLVNECAEAGLSCVRSSEDEYQVACQLGCDNDGEQEFPEQCDGDDVQGLSCGDFGYLPGVGSLACKDSCEFDTSGCRPAPRCGNGRVDWAFGEECDGSAAPSDYFEFSDNYVVACSEYSMGEGEVSCTSGCRLDFSACEGTPYAHCGDGVVEGVEFCETNADSTVDSVFGENVAECSLVDDLFNGQSTLGASGTFTCNALCRPVFDGCAKPELCGNRRRDIGLFFSQAYGEGDASLSIGEGSWTPVSANRYSLFPEPCDGNNLAGLECGDFGFVRGTLACSASCEFDVSACVDVASHCSNGTTDEDETDEDCGGSCAPCGAGALCADGTNTPNADNCLSKKCVEIAGEYKCASASLTFAADDTRNGRETDVDCGGAHDPDDESSVYTPCDAAGKECLFDLDCPQTQGGYSCDDGTCLINNFNTTCAADDECASGFCDDLYDLCWGNNGNWTQEMSGPKENGEACLLAGTDASSECTGEDSRCLAHPSVPNYKICCDERCNQSCRACFSDVGGGTDGVCSNVQAGMLDPNPDSTPAGFCDGQGNSVPALHCLNDIQDMGETDVDCGGPCGPTCGDGQWCVSNIDCDNEQDLQCNSESGQCSTS